MKCDCFSEREGASPFDLLLTVISRIKPLVTTHQQYRNFAVSRYCRILWPCRITRDLRTHMNDDWRDLKARLYGYSHASAFTANTYVVIRLIQLVRVTQFA